MERLNKYLASCGCCSRRDADKLIEEGRVTVDGQRASLGTKVTGQEKICVNGKPVGGKEEKVVFAYYKPVGVVCTERDRHAEKVIADEVRLPVRVTYAGRLDKDSEGLLLLTNDGSLIDAMMHGSAGHEKEYIVRLNREITDVFLKGMTEGVYLSELDVTTRPCEVKKLGKYTCSVILTQGVNRQIRRMVRELGYQVREIKRIRVGNIKLANLKPGEYRRITGNELRSLYNLALDRKKGE